MEAATFEGTERCRCCMASGAPGKDLSDQYDWMGEKEVYADMLLESFDITLSRTAGASWSICDACVARLRDSANFKKQVLHTERSLLQQLISTSIDAEIQLKVEGVKSESVGSDNDDAPEFESHFYEDDDELKDVPVKIEAGASTSNTEMSNDEDLPLSALSGTKRKAPGAKPVQVKRPKLTVKSVKTTAKTTVKATAKAKVATKPVANANAKVALAASKVAAANKLSAQSLLSKLSARPIKITVKSSKPGVAKKGALLGATWTTGDAGSANYKHRDEMRKSNSAILIECSTVCPFKWSVRNGHMCFYCERRFPDPTSLRQHTSTEHDGDNPRPIIRHVLLEDLIKVDITLMKCKLCSEELFSLSQLVEHLKAIHGKPFYERVNEGVIPFKLTSSGFACAVCAKPFRAFHALNPHMSEHYGSYFCETCGAGFVSGRRLHVHQKNHVRGDFGCAVCGRAFDSLGKRNRHATYHVEFNSKCPQCPARFKSYYGRQSHLIREHGLKHLQHACAICAKVFVRKSHLNEHTRKEHMMEKNEHCDVCGAGFFSRTALSNHMVKHTGERTHECAVCKKTYARKRTLVDHMRIHNNDRRFVCVECGMAFVQNCSLKGHIKTHHSN